MTAEQKSSSSMLNVVTSPVGVKHVLILVASVVFLMVGYELYLNGIHHLDKVLDIIVREPSEEVAIRNGMVASGTENDASNADSSEMLQVKIPENKTSETVPKSDHQIEAPISKPSDFDLKERPGGKPPESKPSDAKEGKAPNKKERGSNGKKAEEKDGKKEQETKDAKAQKKLQSKETENEDLKAKEMSKGKTSGNKLPNSDPQKEIPKANGTEIKSTGEKATNKEPQRKSDGEVKSADSPPRKDLKKNTPLNTSTQSDKAQQKLKDATAEETVKHEETQRKSSGSDPQKQTPKVNDTETKILSSEKPEVKKPSYMPPPISETQQKPDNNTRYLVYLCDSKRWCGGWGDRQRGLTHVYLLARLLGRQFKIIMSTPCELSSFYVPNKVNWQPQKGELDTNSSITLIGISSDTVTKTIAKLDFNAAYPQKVVYLKTNRDDYYTLRHSIFYSRTMTHWRGLDDKIVRFRWAWGELMQPTVRLLTQLEHLVGPTFLMKRGLTTKPLGNRSSVTTDVGNSSLICAHVRIGKNPTIPNDGQKPRFRPENLPALFDFMASEGMGRKSSKYFVGTDSDEVRAQAQKYFGDNAIGYAGKIKHVDRQRKGDDACTGFEVALIEQLLMTVCDVLVMSASGFSKYAAYLSDSSAGHVYGINNGTARLINL